MRREKTHYGNCPGGISCWHDRPRGAGKAHALKKGYARVTRRRDRLRLSEALKSGGI